MIVSFGKRFLRRIYNLSTLTSIHHNNVKTVQTMFTSHTSKSFILTWPSTSDGMLKFKNRIDGMLKFKNKITHFKILHIRSDSFHIRTWPTHSTAKKKDSTVKILTAVELHQCPQSLQRISAVPLSSALNPLTRPCHGYDTCATIYSMSYISFYILPHQKYYHVRLQWQLNTHESGHHGLQWI